MKTIAFLSKKGGAGKTSIICQLALYWAEKEWKTVAVSDLEEGGSSEMFIEIANHPKIKLYEEGEQYDFHLIDTPGGTSDEDLKQILKTVDLAIVPFIPGGGVDLNKTAQTLSILGKSKKVRVLFSMVRPYTKEGMERHDNIEDMGNPKTFESFLQYRAPYKKLANGDTQNGFTPETLTELQQLAREIAP